MSLDVTFVGGKKLGSCSSILDPFIVFDGAIGRTPVRWTPPDQTCGHAASPPPPTHSAHHRCTALRPHFPTYPRTAHAHATHTTRTRALAHFAAARWNQRAATRGTARLHHRFTCLNATRGLSPDWREHRRVHRNHFCGTARQRTACARCLCARTPLHTTFHTFSRCTPTDTTVGDGTALGDRTLRGLPRTTLFAKHRTPAPCYVRAPYYRTDEHARRSTLPRTLLVAVWWMGRLSRVASPQCYTSRLFSSGTLGLD